MQTTDDPKQKTRILVDLKPALDGYSGIPQETRLLFDNFKRLGDEYSVDGLLQHGSGIVLSNDPKQYVRMAPHERVILDSQLVSSLCTGLVKAIVPRLPARLQLALYKQILYWKSFANTPIKMGIFQSSLFSDFIWRYFFSKSIGIEEKERLTASRFRVIEPSRSHMHSIGLGGLRLFPSSKYLKLDTRKYDFLVSQTPFPARLMGSTRLIVRYHDAVPILMPHTIGDRMTHQAMHYHALKANVESDALFVCNSEATRDDLLSIFPQVESRTTVIYNVVMPDYFQSDEPKESAWNIINNRQDAEDNHLGEKAPFSTSADAGENSDSDYLLMVSTIEPRKNHELLLSAWEKVRLKQHNNLKLVIVGSRGWDYEPVIKMMRPWIRRGALYHLTNVPAQELRVLYKHAAATICPSLAEGFDYSGVEAMRCGGLVAASDIPVHREVFGDGSAYFNPYSVEDAINVINRLLAPENVDEQEALRQNGVQNSKRYEASALLPQWQDFIQRNISAS